MGSFDGSLDGQQLCSCSLDIYSDHLILDGFRSASTVPPPPPVVTLVYFPIFFVVFQANSVTDV